MNIPKGATHRVLGETSDFYRQVNGQWEVYVWHLGWYASSQKENLRPLDDREQTRNEIIALVATRCGFSGDMIRQLATVLVAEGYRKFEIVEEDVWPISY